MNQLYVTSAAVGLAIAMTGSAHAIIIDATEYVLGVAGKSDHSPSTGQVIDHDNKEFTTTVTAPTTIPALELSGARYSAKATANFNRVGVRAVANTALIGFDPFIGIIADYGESRASASVTTYVHVRLRHSDFFDPQITIDKGTISIEYPQVGKTTLSTTDSLSVRITAHALVVGQIGLNNADSRFHDTAGSGAYQLSVTNPNAVDPRTHEDPHLSTALHGCTFNQFGQSQENGKAFVNASVISNDCEGNILRDTISLTYFDFITNLLFYFGAPFDRDLLLGVTLSLRVDAAADAHELGNAAISGLDTLAIDSIAMVDSAGNVVPIFDFISSDGGVFNSPQLTTTARADFNGDSLSEILWRNSGSGENAIWRMNGLTLSSSSLIAGVADTNWQVWANGDFDADGKADILWRNASTGDNAVWLMNGYTLAASALINNVADPAWTIAGTGDFDSDGKADILWRNTVTGDNAIWLMNGLGVASTALIPGAAATWAISGIGDFNGDGKADILWRNTSTGDTAVWLMNGSTLTASALVLPVPTAWTIAGVADYNGDGKADILWRNTTTGENAIWLMNGFSRSSSALIAGVTDTSWTIVGVGDYDGDGKADILWRNTTTGDNAVWLMDGFTLRSSALIPRVSDMSWAISNR